MSKSKFQNPLSPRKHLGQNFLVDPRAKDRIITSCELSKEEEILEIGPGLGHLTEMILPHVKKIYAVEKDPRFCEELRRKFSPSQLEVFEADVLKFNFNNLNSGLKVIGNLPYYISTPIIEEFIKHRDKFPRCFFTVQKEFADRLAAKAGSDDYGSLSCFVQYYADVKILFKLPPSSFKPAPKVTSSFIRLDFRPPTIKVADEERLFSLIRTAFGQRRKQIANSLKIFLGQDQVMDILRECGLTGKERAENLNLENYAALLKASSSRQTSG